MSPKSSKKSWGKNKKWVEKKSGGKNKKQVEKKNRGKKKMGKSVGEKIKVGVKKKCNQKV